jgi:hypothetical protein
VQSVCHNLLLLNRRYSSLCPLVCSTIAFQQSLSNTLFFQFSILTVCRSFRMSSSHLFFGLPIGLETSGFHFQILVTSLSCGILSTWHIHFSRWDLINHITFCCCIRSSSSSFVLILQRPFDSLVGPKIFRNIFLVCHNTGNNFTTVSEKLD